VYAAGLLIAVAAGAACGVGVRASVGGVAAPLVFGAGAAIVVFAVMRAQWWPSARRDAVNDVLRASAQRGEAITLDVLAAATSLRHLADAALREESRRSVEGAP